MGRQPDAPTTTITQTQPPAPVTEGAAPSAEVTRLAGAGLAVSMRLARRGVTTTAQVAALRVEELADLAGVDAERAGRIHAAANGAPAEVPAGTSPAPSLVGTVDGFVVAPVAEVAAEVPLTEDDVAARVALMKSKDASRAKGPLASARACPRCGQIESYPDKDIARPREPGEMPRHGSRFNYSPHLCDGKGTVSVGKAGSALREKAARRPENAAVFREYLGG